MKYIILLVVCYFSLSYAAETKPGRFLSLPVPQKCANRPSRTFEFSGKRYFYTGHEPGYEGKRFTWDGARQICQQYCTQPISIETQAENDMVLDLMAKNQIPYLWTSGRICAAPAKCTQSDRVSGWTWQSTGGRIHAASSAPQGWSYRPWSNTGHFKRIQPDNAEQPLNGNTEDCLALLSSVYQDGITWHDVACYHEKATICEDESGYRDMKFGNNYYFYSGDHNESYTETPNWLYGRNLCREYCMDAVSIDDQKENEFVKAFMKREKIRTLWTSGRLCDFPGCNGTFTGDLWVDGWFWSADRVPIAAVNKTASGWTYNPWGKSGPNKKPQPDNAEFAINESKEACIALFQDVYEDGITWNDVACYQEFHVLCEDNKELLEYVRSTNPELSKRL